MAIKITKKTATAFSITGGLIFVLSWFVYFAAAFSSYDGMNRYECIDGHGDCVLSKEEKIEIASQLVSLLGVVIATVGVGMYIYLDLDKPKK